jgi:PAS domain S-box-containing protein
MLFRKIGNNLKISCTQFLQISEKIMNEKASFLSVVRLWGIVFLISFGIIIIGIDMMKTYYDFTVRVDKIRKDYDKQQKQMIRNEIYNVVEIINNKKSKCLKRGEADLKSRIYEMHSIIQNIYIKNKDVKSESEIKKMILDVFRPVRFDKGRGYYFIDTLSGKNVLYPIDPKFEGENIIDFQDAKGKYVVKEEIQLLKDKGEGFIIGYWPKAGFDPKKSFKKITFVKLFKPYNWSIGTGMYVDDFEEKRKTEVLKDLVKIRFGQEREGYIFGSTFKGDALFSNGKITRGEKSVWDLTDPDGIKIIQGQRKEAEKPEGGFFRYSWKKLNNNVPSPKISFTMGIPEWEWMIGAGVYLDDVEKKIALMHETLNHQIKIKTLNFILIVTVVLLLFILLINRLDRILQKDFNLFISFFDRAAYSDEKINRDTVKFYEFQQMADYANKMLLDKKTAQQGLMDEKEELSVTLKSIGDGVITTDITGKILLINTVAEKLTGWKQDEAAGKMLPEVFSIINSDTGKSENPVAEVLSYGSISHMENNNILISKKGKYNITNSAAPILDVKNNIRGVVLVFRDVTEQLKTEAELFKARKLESIGILAGGIAHDFNNVLAGIFGNIELARMKLNSGHPSDKHLEIAENSIESASNLTKQLLTFSRGGDPIIESVNIQEIIKKSIRFNLSGSNIKASLNLPDDLWQIKADKGQISQVIANLTINARQAMPEKGNLYIEAENTGNPKNISGNFVKITIKDEGGGIPENIIDKIFDPYFSTKQAGSGLGLATVHSIITKHKGQIHVSSEAGTGTTFTIFIPAEKDSQKIIESKPGHEEKKTIKKSLNILLMDDDKVIMDVMKIALNMSGHQVDFAADGNEAVKKYKAAMDYGIPYDVVITDLTIPGAMGGKETVKELLRIDPKANVIVSSGYSTDPVMADYTEYGFKGRLIKPYKNQAMKEEIMRVLKQKTR